MGKTNFAGRVGLFVFVGLVLLALLLIQFSKGTTFFRGTYELHLRAANVGGLKPRAAVLLAGVQVGSVSDIQLAADTKSVTIFLKIYKRYTIYSDARFVIEQSGFLGDQYVSVIPTDNRGEKLKDGAEVTCQEPFNLLEVARSASGFVKRIDETAKKLDAAVTDVRRLLLNDQTLTNLAASINNMRTASESAVQTVDKIDALVSSNTSPVASSVSNVVFFSQELNRLVEKADSLLATNGPDLTAAVKNIESSTVVLKSLLDDLQAGKGLAGSLLKNELLATNIDVIANNLAITSSNLNRLGLWGILWKRHEAGTHEPPPKPVAAPHDPFR